MSGDFFFIAYVSGSGSCSGSRWVIV